MADRSQYYLARHILTVFLVIGCASAYRWIGHRPLNSIIAAIFGKAAVDIAERTRLP